MSDLNTLVSALERVTADMQSLATTAESSTDESAAAGFRAAFKAKSAEAKGLQDKIADARTLLETQRAIAEAKSFSSPALMDTSANALAPVAGEDARGKSVSADVVMSPDREERAKVEFFAKWFDEGPGALEGRALSAIAIGKGQRGHQPGSCVRVPNRMVQAMYFGKTATLIHSSHETGYATDSGANALVPPNYQGYLRPPYTVHGLFELCRLVPAQTGKAEFSLPDTAAGRFYGVASTWKAAEGTDALETLPFFKDFSFVTHELSSWVQPSLTMMNRSAIDLEAEIVTLMRDAARHEFSRVILNGNGTTQPLGVLTAGSGVTSVNRKVVGQVGWEDLSALEYAVSQANRIGARYVVADSAEKYLKQAVDSQKRPLYTIDTASGIRNQMAGYTYIAHEHETPVLGSAGDVIFGNWQNYCFGIEQDVSIARSDHVAFKTGHVVFRMISYVGGKPWNPAGLAILAATGTEA